MLRLVVATHARSVLPWAGNGKGVNRESQGLGFLDIWASNVKGFERGLQCFHKGFRRVVMKAL